MVSYIRVVVEHHDHQKFLADSPENLINTPVPENVSKEERDRVIRRRDKGWHRLIDKAGRTGAGGGTYEVWKDAFAFVRARADDIRPSVFRRLVSECPHGALQKKFEELKKQGEFPLLKVMAKADKSRHPKKRNNDTGGQNDSGTGNGASVSCGAQKPMTRAFALELIESKGDDTRARKRRAAGWFNLVATTAEPDDWQDTALRLASGFGTVPRGAVENFFRNAPEEALVRFEEVLLDTVSRTLTHPEKRTKWSKRELWLAHQVIDIVGEEDPRTKRVFQGIVDTDDVPLFPSSVTGRVDIRWPTFEKVPAFLSSGRCGPPPETLEKKRKRAEKDRELRARMRGSGGGGAQQLRTSNPQKAAKRERKAAQKKKGGGKK